NIGQSAYAAANSVLDSIIEFRRKLGIPGNSLQWGAWAEQGMAAENELLHKNLINVGLSLINNNIAFEIIKYIIFGSKKLPSVLAIQPANWDKFINKTGIKYGILKEITNGIIEEKSTILNSISAENRIDFISNKIISICGEILGIEIDLNSEQSLMDFGVDSIMAIEIRNSLCDNFGVPLPHTILFDYPTVSSLATYINQKSILNCKIEKNQEQTNSNKNLFDCNIAIIGAACRLPKNITNLSELWELLIDSKCSVGKIPYNRWDSGLFFSEQINSGKMYTESASFINGIEFFDNSEFKISSSEVNYIDPQQRIIMETTLLAIKSSNFKLETLSNSYTGVFIGCSSGDWTILTNTASIPPGPYTGTGISPSIISNRISYIFGFQGPSFTIDSACSSSLVAIDSAYDKFKSNNIQFAIVGGVNLLLSPQPFLACCAANMLSFDGVCRTFDEKANGYGRGEGSISLLLTHLSKAKENNEKILGVIKSSSVNQDGKSATITAPNGPSQRFVIRNAIEKANLFPSKITYIETHGTGTKLGDPIEFNAIRSVFNLEDNIFDNNICLLRYSPLYLGAIKANIGHLEGAAGIAGLIKLLLVLNYKVAVPIPNLKKINPLIELNDFNAVLPMDKEPVNIKSDSNVIYGGISSFGFGGTNAHVIIECNSDNIVENSKFFHSENLFLRRKNYSWSDTKHPLINEKILEKVDNKDLQLDGIRLFRNINKKTFNSVKFALNINNDIKNILSDHVIGNKIIWPAAAYIEMILAVAKHVYICNNEQISFSKRILKTNLRNLLFEQPLILEENTENRLVCDLDLKVNRIKIYSDLTGENNSELIHVSAEMGDTNQIEIINEGYLLNNLETLIKKELDISLIYDKLKELGIQYGNKFKTIEKAWKLKSENEALAKIKLNSDECITKSDDLNIQEPILSLTELGFGIHPALLDGALQSCFICISDLESNLEKVIWVPFSISEVEFYNTQEPILEAWVHCKVSPTNNKNEVISDIKIYSMNKDLLLNIKNIKYRSTIDINNKMIKHSKQNNIENIENCWGLSWKKIDNILNKVENRKWMVYLGDKIEKKNSLNNNSFIYYSNKNSILEELIDYSGEVNIAYVINSGNNDKLHNYSIEVINWLENLYNVNSKISRSSFILFITENTIPYDNNNYKFIGSDIWGLVRSARYELNKYSLNLLDLDCRIKDLNEENLFKIFSCVLSSNESEFVFRNGELSSPRLSKIPIPINGPYNIRLTERGALTNLLTEIQSNIPYINSEKKLNLIDCFDNLDNYSLIKSKPILKDNEVLLRVCSVGLNFRDVLNVMDLYPGDPGPPCSDCSGIVVSVGKDVKHLKCGDEVYAMVPGCLNTFIVAIGDTCCLMPNNCDFSLASSIPTIYSTVDICLRKICNIKKGDRVLIHAASGGVGLVAVNYCNSVGAEVFATVGNNKKEKYLRHLGVKNISTSRNPKLFKLEMEHLLEREKLDVVINCLSGKYIEYSLELLSNNGIFIELGKINILSKEDVSLLRPGIKYEIVALDDLIINDPAWFGTVLTDIKTRIEECKESVVPLIEFSIENSKEESNDLINQSGCISGFRFMQRANHIGKVIIKNPTLDDSLSNKNGIVIVIGGSGSLGRFTTKWLYFNGLKNIILLSRNSINSISNLPGVKHIKCDISNINSTISAINVIIKNSEDRPIIGIIHTAGVLDDRKLFEHSKESFEYVYSPKVQGLWNIHQITQYLSIELEFLIAYSSIASLLGNMGQANYSAANSFIDSFMSYRSSLGINSFSIQWGPWVGEGMASNNLSLKFESTGLIGVDKFTAMQVLNTVIKSGKKSIPNVICVVDADWVKLISNIPSKTSNMFTDIINKNVAKEKNDKSKIMEILEKKSSIEMEDYIINLLRDIIKTVVNDDIDINDSKLLDKPLHEFGIDSLSAVEFRNILSKHTGILLPTTLMFDYPTIINIKDYIVSEMEGIRVEERSYDALVTDIKKNKIVDIAIIGLSCKLPGSTEDIDSFWEVLTSGIDCISNIPVSRWDHKKYYSLNPENFGPYYYANYGSFIDDIDKFDAQYFGISPSEAAIIDPQQRLSLMLGVKSIEDANLNLSKLKGTKTGVYVGCGNSDWAIMQGNQISESEFISPYTGTSVALSLISNRISYNLGLNGPSMTVDTACSSSLVALDIAVQNLRWKKCNISIVIGVNLLLSPQAYIVFSKSKMLSITGSCKAFDKDADGYVRGEGCCSLVLCRFHETENLDFDKRTLKFESDANIYGFIKGSAVNQDGRSASLTAPNGPAQQKVIKSAIEDSSIKLDEISIVEAHGTGTQLGDPIEFGAIKNVFGSRNRDPIYITALKTNIGHLEGASGIAGVIKMVLMLNYSIIPKNLHFKILNPLIDSSNFNVIIPNQNLTVSACLGGVSSFGFGGTNAHVIIEKNIKKLPLANQSYSEIGKTNKEVSKGIIFIFTGQGSQFENMGQELFENEPIFRKTILECAKYADEYLPESLIEILYPGVSTPKTKAGSKDSGFYDINDIQYSQVAIFSLEYSLAKLLESRGITPDLVIGHSLGEYCAAVIVGAIELNQALKMIINRSKIMGKSNISDGGMLALRKSANSILEVLKEFDENSVSLAAINGPNSVVISGRKYALESILQKLGGGGKFLNIENAFHSSLMQDVSNNYKDFIEEEIMFGNGNMTKIKFVSTLKGRLINCSELLSSNYWSDHIVCPVLFYDAINHALNELDCKILLEIGPQPILTKLSIQCIPKELRTKIKSFCTMLGKPCTEVEHFELVVNQINQIICPYLNNTKVNSKVDNKNIFNNLRRFPWTNINLHPFLKFETDRKVSLQNLNKIFEISKEGLIIELFNGGVREIFKDEIFNSMKMGRYDHCQIILENLTFNKIQGSQHFWLEVEKKDINGFKVNIFSQNDLICSSNTKILFIEDAGVVFQDINVENSVVSIEKFISFDLKENISFQKIMNSIEELAIILKSEVSYIENVQKNAICLILTTGDYFKSLSKSFTGYSIHPFLLQLLFDFIKLYNIEEVIHGNSDINFHETVISELLDSSISQKYLIFEVNNHSAMIKDNFGKLFFKTDYSLAYSNSKNIGSVEYEIEQFSIFNNLDNLIWNTENQQIFETEVDIDEIEVHNYKSRGTLIVGSNDLEHNLDSEESVYSNIRSEFELIRNIKLRNWEKIIFIIDEFNVSEIELMHYAVILCKECALDSNVWFIKINQLIENSSESYNKGGGILGLCKSTRIELRKIINYMVIERFEDLSTNALLICNLVYTKVIKPQYSIQMKNDNLNKDNELINGIILISGGTGALGLIITEWLIKHKNVSNIILLSRSGLPSKRCKSIWERILVLNSNVQIIKCDVANYSSVLSTLKDIISQAVESNSRIVGLIHASGVLSDSLIKNHSIQSLENVFGPKVFGAINLHNAIKNILPYKLKFFIGFSSISSLFGGFGQYSYSSANSYLDSLINYRRKLRESSILDLSIQWGPWAEQGMAADLFQHHSSSGIRPIYNSEGLKCLSAIFDIIEGGNTELILPSEIAIANINWNEFLTIFENRVPFIFSEINNKLLNNASKLECNSKIIKDKFEGITNIRKHIEEILLIIAYEIFGMEQDNYDLTEIDSLMAVEFRNSIFKNFGIKLPISLMLDNPTLDEVISYLEGEVRRELFGYNTEELVSSKSRRWEEISQDINLNGEISLQSNSSDVVRGFRLPSGEKNKLREVFLTGGTGFMGSCMIENLVKLNDDIKIWCLVRCSDRNNGKEKLLDALNKYSIQDAELIIENNIKIVVGDTSIPSFGISKAEYKEIVNSIDSIIHIGAVVNFSSSYSNIKGVNVLSLIELLKLSSAPDYCGKNCTKKEKCNSCIIPIHHVSTLGVFYDHIENPPVGPYLSGLENTEFMERIYFLDDGRRIFYEDDPVITNDNEGVHHKSLLLGYSQSKWAAERILRSARERGFPIAIYRPGRIGGNSKTGASNISDLPNAFVKGCIKMGTLPKTKMAIHLVSVDFCCQVCCFGMNNPTLSINNDYNLDSEEWANMDDIKTALQLLGIELEMVEFEDWAEQLLDETSKDRNHPLTPLQHMFVKERPADSIMPYFDMKNTNNLISISGNINHVPCDSNYLLTCFRYLLEKDWIYSIESINKRVLNTDICAKEYIFQFTNDELKVGDLGITNFMIFICDKLFILNIQEFCNKIQSKYNCRCLVVTIPNSKVENILSLLYQIIHKAIKENIPNINEVNSKIIIGSWSISSSLALKIFKNLKNDKMLDYDIKLLLIDPVVPVKMNDSNDSKIDEISFKVLKKLVSSSRLLYSSLTEPIADILTNSDSIANAYHKITSYAKNGSKAEFEELKDVLERLRTTFLISLNISKSALEVDEKVYFVLSRSSIIGDVFEKNGSYAIVNAQNIYKINDLELLHLSDENHFTIFNYSNIESLVNGLSKIFN
ncbi:polyketide synthase, partial [Cryptosporidium sp. chipmunk genotype I]|uniref:polyketide synthase n=1 Tax=Cryptosporidium sp. chipmunk genotype I TaxID=1280935 RepID=UPI00351A843B